MLEQQTGSEQAKPPEVQPTQKTAEDLVRGALDPLDGLSPRISCKSSLQVHASTLNRATGSRPSLAGHSLIHLQRKYGNRYVQRVLALARSGGGEAAVAPEVEIAIERARGGGQVLDTGVRAQMETAFGSDFSNVRVHTDSEADYLNESLNSVAFATGQDIFFRQGEYRPGTSAGRELLAHELTHVVQQNGASLQTKLAVGSPNDEYEQEADRVAKVVVNKIEAGETPQKSGSDSGGHIQRKCACGGSAHSDGECDDCRRKRLQRQTNSNEDDHTPKSGKAPSQFPRMSFGEALTSVVQAHGMGQPLSPDVRTFMETRFGQDFSSVRLHSDPGVARAVRMTSANAFTVGNHVFWGKASVRPDSHEGKQLLAHELVHVLQQRQAGLNSSTANNYSLIDGGASEREADRVAADVVGGQSFASAQFGQLTAGASAKEEVPVQISPVTTTVQRQDDGSGTDGGTAVAADNSGATPTSSGGFTDCVNSCLSSQGITGAITTLIWVGCGIIGGIGALGGTLVEPGGGSLTGLGLALAGCIAIGTGFPIGVIISCLKQCA